MDNRLLGTRLWEYVEGHSNDFTIRPVLLDKTMHLNIVYL